MYKIMIVDDEMLVRIGVKALIDWQELGFEIVAEAGNGQTAYEKYVALKPDLVITDIKMPKQDGIWLTKKIKEYNPNTEIIFLTCYDDFTYAKEAIKLRVSDYILKAEMEEEELRKILLEKKKKLDVLGGQKPGIQKDNPLMKKQQEYLLGLLLSSNRSNELVREEFMKAQVEWNTRKYCFIQFDFRSSLKNEKNADYQIANIISACLELIVNKFQDEEVEVFSKQFGKSITCFLMSSNLNEIKIQKCIDYLKSSFKQYFNISYKSVNSPVTSTIEGTREYLGWIFAASDYLFYIREGEHLTKETMHQSEGSFIYDAAMVKEFCQYIEEADLDAIFGKIDDLEKLLDRQRSNSLEVKLELSHMVNDIFKRFDSCFQEDKDVFDFQKRIINSEELREAIEIIRDFLKNIIAENSANRADNAEILIKKAVQYINDHFNKKVTLEDISGYVGISKYYFSVLFKKEMDITFSSYLNSVRIDKAKQLLKNPQMTINDMVDEVGFNDAQYFSKTFKKYVGMTVTEYRSRYEK
ncbi:MAG TPA: response regulator [Clostridiales bacterium]|nr:response regulator [Clostridiales bacterium]